MNKGINGNMEKELLSKLLETTEDTNKKVGEMHTTIFGAQGQGGLLREHKEFKEATEEELAILNKHREDMVTFKAKLLAVVGLISAIASFFGSKIASIISKTP